MYKGLHAGRLATVIDCGTINGFKKIYLGFQLSEFMVEPKNKELPMYAMYAKTNYGGLINGSLDAENKHILEALGYDESEGGDILDFLLDNAGGILNINVVDNEYNGKTYPLVSYEGHTKHEGDLDIGWGTEIKKFKLTDKTTRDDVSKLGFENKFLKKSDEFAELPRLDLDENSIDDLF